MPSVSANQHSVIWPLCDNHYYYSFKIFLRFWLAFNPRLIPANRLAPTKFGRNSNYWIATVQYQKLLDRNLVLKDDYPIATSFPRTADVTRLNGFAAEQVESAKMAARFEHYEEVKFKVIRRQGKSKHGKSNEGESIDFESVSSRGKDPWSSHSGGLGAVLRKFYVEVSKNDGNLYSKTSLCVIRFSFNRHFKQVLNIDIIKDKKFNEGNRVFEV